MHPSTFEYLQPSIAQIADMSIIRQATKQYAEQLDAGLPDGADKTYILRKVREIGMWANVSITREADGTPRTS